MLQNIIFAGFGGQGVLFAGKVTSYAGLMDDKEVSWLPSYGPEMRGGTANCSVVISDSPIGSPLVINPDLLVAMNLPSYDKFIDMVAPGGIVVMDSSMIDREITRKDITVYKVPASSLANSENLQGLANMILLGKVFSVVDLASKSAIEKAVQKSVPAKKAHLLEANMRALDLGAKQ